MLPSQGCSCRFPTAWPLTKGSSPSQVHRICGRLSTFRAGRLACELQSLSWGVLQVFPSLPVPSCLEIIISSFEPPKASLMGSREASGLGSSGFHSTLFVSRLCLFCFRCPCTQNWLFCHPVFLPFVLVSTIPLTVSTHLSILNLLLFPPNPCCNKQASSSQYWIGLVNISLPRAMEDVVWSLKNWKLCMEQDCFITACKDPCGIASTVGCRPCARGALIPRWRERESLMFAQNPQLCVSKLSSDWRLLCNWGMDRRV